MAQIKIIYRNILENSTVNPTNASTAYPAYRLYDRDIGNYYVASATAEPFYITIDQGASGANTIYPADRLIISSSHNLDGLEVVIQYSSDNFAADINSATSWTQSGNGTIDKSITSATQRYWRLYIVSPTTPPKMSEMFLGADYSFQRNPSPGSRTGKKTNIMREETQAGRRMAIKLGEVRKQWTYDLSVIETTQKEDFETWTDHTEGLKPFYITDENSNLNYVEMLNDLDFTYIPGRNYFRTVIDLLEVL